MNWQTDLEYNLERLSRNMRLLHNVAIILENRETFEQLGMEHPHGLTYQILANKQIILKVDSIWIHAAYEEYFKIKVSQNEIHRLLRMFFDFPNDDSSIQKHRVGVTFQEDSYMSEKYGTKNVRATRYSAPLAYVEKKIYRHSL